MPSVASDLLLDLAERFAPSPTLVIGGEAALANALSGESAYLPVDVRELDQATVRIVSDPEHATFASVLIPAPPDRDLLRHHLLVAAQALQPGGVVIICGANAEGGKSAIKDAEALFGAPTWSGYRDKHRMAILRKGAMGAPEWSSQPGIAPHTWQSFIVATPWGELTLETHAGVFAGAKLDAGTRLLLEHLMVPMGGSILDLGCGTGIIGICAARAGASSVTMTDTNLRAIAAARRNADTHDVPATAVPSDVFAHLGAARFDAIVSNPPFHRGKQIDLTVADRLIGDAPEHLHPGGTLTIVANAFLAYDKHMRQIFPQVEIVAATPQFHILRGTLRDESPHL